MKPNYLSNHLSKLPLTTLTLSSVLLMTTTLTGCGKFFSKPVKVNEPTPLVKLTQTANTLTPLFQQTLGTSQRVATKNSFGKNTLTQANSGFKVATDSQGYVAASPNGTVITTDMNGKKLWQVGFNQGLSAGASLDTASNTVIVTDSKGGVIALERTTGKVRWQHDVGSLVLSPALISNNRVIVLSNNGVVNGLSLQNGDIIWQFGTQNPALSVRGSASPILLDASHTLVSTADGRIHAININDGVPVWSRRISNSQGASDIDRLIDIDATPVLQGNMLYVLTYSGQLVAIDMTTRQLAFVKEYAGLKSVAVDASQVVLTTLTGEVVALNRTTGDTLWSNDSLRYRGLSNPVITNNTVIVGDALGYIHVLDKASGQVIEREQARQDVSYLTLTNQRLAAQSSMGNFGVWQVTP